MLMPSFASSHLAQLATSLTKTVKKLSYLTLPPCSRRDPSQSRPFLTVWINLKHSTCKNPGIENMNILSKPTFQVLKRGKLMLLKRYTLENKVLVQKVTTLMILTLPSEPPIRTNKWISRKKISGSSKKN